MTAMEHGFVTSAALWNGLVRCMTQPIALRQGHVQLRETDAPPPDAPLAFVVTVTGAQVALVVDAYPMAEQTGTDLSLGDLATLPAALRDGLALGVADSLRALLPAPLDRDARISLAPPSAAETWLAADIDVGGGTARCRIGASRATFCQIFRALAPDGPGALPALPGSLAEAIALRFDVALGAMTAPLGAVRGLGAGDILLAGIAPGRCMLEHPRGRFGVSRATAEDGSDETYWQIGDFTMTTDDKPDPGGGDTAADAFADIPIRLSFVTGSLTQSLAEAQALVAGAVIPLDVPQAEPGLAVRILANGTPVGDGHLVQIDDGLAVRIARIAGESGPEA